MVDPAGSVIGLVFAVATDRSAVAYALTTTEIQAVLGSVGTSAGAVDTGACLG
jgi:hypothetical protein